ncbi:aldehyde ferredoxin oxidoreductase N-terminal domain-containing protein [Nonomuraea fuscirosea]|uniref:aldehyde ferredoxin oxidoreductase N-terminal domain-containing protein n=1 Tax=Nonomuraea fuscirosea TaxID=1291556 RepID=UPI00342CA1A4
MPFIVDLTSGNVEQEDRTREKGHYGGTVLGLRLMGERTAPGLDPYDPGTLLYVAAGTLGGTAAPGLAKAVFLAKSPLTGVAGEAHALGSFAAGMRAAGAKALAVLGRAERLSYLLVRDGEVTLHDAGELDEERGRRSARLLRLWSGLDALNLCVFASSPTRPLTVDRLTALVTAVLGTEFTLDDLLAAGQARLDGMRAYALREQPDGLDEKLPARLHEEPVTQGPHKGAVLERTAFDRARAAFYAELGWTATDGDISG